MSVLTTKLPQLRRSANEAMWKAWHGAGLHKGTPSEVACIKNLIDVALPQVEKVKREALETPGAPYEFRAWFATDIHWRSLPTHSKSAKLRETSLPQRGLGSRSYSGNARQGVAGTQLIRDGHKLKGLAVHHHAQSVPFRGASGVAPNAFGRRSGGAYTRARLATDLDDGAQGHGTRNEFTFEAPACGSDIGRRGRSIEQRWRNSNRLPADSDKEPGLARVPVHAGDAGGARSAPISSSQGKCDRAIG